MTSTFDHYERTLKSIAESTCCEGCREAALVARACLRTEGVKFIDRDRVGLDERLLTILNIMAKQGWDSQAISDISEAVKLARKYEKNRDDLGDPAGGW